jgi:hypothetical protein
VFVLLAELELDESYMSSVDKIDKIYVINHGSHCTSLVTYTAVLSEIQIEQNALI